MLPTDPAERKAIPLCTGCYDYFPNALAKIAICSRIGNDQHNPEEPLHWARGKSADHADCCARHLQDRGKIGKDGQSHTVHFAWRALALLEEECLAELAKEPVDIADAIEESRRFGLITTHRREFG